MGTFSIWHWLVVLAVIVLVFGTKKLRSLGGDMGAAVRGFKQGMREDDHTPLENNADSIQTDSTSQPAHTTHTAQASQATQHQTDTKPPTS